MCAALSLAKHFATLITLGVLVTGCAGGEAQYPSLAVRPGERATGTIAAPAAPVQSAPVAAPAELAGLVAEARRAHADFLSSSERARTRSQAAQGAEPGSENWSLAHLALADLTAHRSRTMVVLADLDRLSVDAANAGAVPEELASQHREVEQMAAQEDRILGELRALVAQ